MAKRKRKSSEPERQATVQDKIAGCLALIAVRGMEKPDAALKLDAIGFGAAEISSLLDVGPNYVHFERFKLKKKRKS